MTVSHLGSGPVPSAAVHTWTSASSAGMGDLGCLLSKCCLKVLGSGICVWKRIMLSNDLIQNCSHSDTSVGNPPDIGIATDSMDRPVPVNCFYWLVAAGIQPPTNLEQSVLLCRSKSQCQKLPCSTTSGYLEAFYSWWSFQLTEPCTIFKAVHSRGGGTSVANFKASNLIKHLRMRHVNNNIIHARRGKDDEPQQKTLEAAFREKFQMTAKQRQR